MDFTRKWSRAHIYLSLSPSLTMFFLSGKFGVGFILWLGSLKSQESREVVSYIIGTLTWSEANELCDLVTKVTKLILASLGKVNHLREVTNLSIDYSYLFSIFLMNLMLISVSLSGRQDMITTQAPMLRLTCLHLKDIMIPWSVLTGFKCLRRFSPDTSLPTTSAFS